MRITLSNDSLTDINADLLVVGVSQSTPSKDRVIKALNKAYGGGIDKLAAAEGFEGKASQTLKFPSAGTIKAKWVVLVGTKDLNAVDAARALGHAAAKASSRQTTAAIALGKANGEAVRGATESCILGTYRYDDYKTGDRKAKGGLKQAKLVIAKTATEHRNAVKAGSAIAEGVALARDLVNMPPNDLNPVSFADISKKEAAKLGIKATIWNKKKIQAAKMNLFLAVNAGSAIEPRLIHLHYAPKGAKKKIAFVGKGLTFDAGGLCIKPGKSMADMKCDMGGGATTLGIIVAAAKMKLPIEIHALIGSTENQLGAAAYRPGDVYTSHDGKKVEIINTDAEGRLVLADVLAWTRDNVKPDLIVDHATLTGACMVALGPRRAAMYSDYQEYADAYKKAADASGEKYWQLPLDKDLRPMLNSPIADLKHIGGSYGGSITAALFLQEFVGDTPWMHFDIAGPAYLDGAHKRSPKGGTGFGVATAVRFLEKLSAKK